MKFLSIPCFSDEGIYFVSTREEVKLLGHSAYAFTFVRDTEISFQSGSIKLHDRWMFMKVPVAPHTGQFDSIKL